MIPFPGMEGYKKTVAEERLAALCDFWNLRAGADMDTDGAIEAELEAAGFTTRTKRGKPRRDLCWHDADGWEEFFRENSNYWRG